MLGLTEATAHYWKLHIMGGARRVTGGLPRQPLTISYDRKSDVLYVSLGEPRPAVSQETENGVLLREDLEAGEVVGMTVLDFMKRWPGPNLVLPDQTSIEDQAPLVGAKRS